MIEAIKVGIPVRCGKSDLGTFLISKLNEYPKYNTILYK